MTCTRLALLCFLFLPCFLMAKKRAPRIPNKVVLDRSAPNYVVLRGDWLSSIAESYFGNQEDWKKIVKYNPAIKNPDLIYPGDVISFELLNQLRETATISQDLPTLVPHYAVWTSQRRRRHD